MVKPIIPEQMYTRSMVTPAIEPLEIQLIPCHLRKVTAKLLYVEIVQFSNSDGTETVDEVT